MQFTYIPPDSRTPYLQSWNLGVQRDLGAGVVLDVSYVGNKDSKLWARTWPNQPRPGAGRCGFCGVPSPMFRPLRVTSPSRQRQLQCAAGACRPPFERIVDVSAGYTWSKAITDNYTIAETGAGVPDLQDNNNRRANRGLWSADARHRFTLSSVYELPFGSRTLTFSGDARGVLGKVVSGWQLATIVTVQSGQPLTATLPFDNPNVGEGAKLPNLIHNPNDGPENA